MPITGWALVEKKCVASSSGLMISCWRKKKSASPFYWATSQKFFHSKKKCFSSMLSLTPKTLFRRELIQFGGVLCIKPSEFLMFFWVCSAFIMVSSFIFVGYFFNLLIRLVHLAIAYLFLSFVFSHFRVYSHIKISSLVYTHTFLFIYFAEAIVDVVVLF